MQADPVAVKRVITEQPMKIQVETDSIRGGFSEGDSLQLQDKLNAMSDLSIEEAPISRGRTIGNLLMGIDKKRNLNMETLNIFDQPLPPNFNGGGGGFNHLQA